MSEDTNIETLGEVHVAPNSKEANELEGVEVISLLSTINALKIK